MCPSDHQDSGAAINCQIQLALLSSCISLAMSCCFDPDGVPVRDMPNIFFSSLMATNMERPKYNSASPVQARDQAGVEGQPPTC